MTKPKILVVEDIEEVHFSYQRRFGEQVRYFAAQTLDEARQIFQENPDLAAIAMDACLIGKIPDTLELTKEFRQTFAGPIIAISGSLSFRKQLLAAGCDWYCDKWELPALMRLLLNVGGGHAT